MLVVAWQVEEHVRVQEAAKTICATARRRSPTLLSAVIRALRFRSTVLQDRLEPVLKLLVNGHTNELVKSGELISVTLLNTAGEPVVAVGETNFNAKDSRRKGNTGVQTA